MKAVAINGSPRKGGNTEILLRRVLDVLDGAGWETDLVRVANKEIRGCIACYKCFENKDMRCAVDNDMFNDVMERLVRADAMIFGTPTYFTDVSADLKAVIDRAGLVAIANDRAFRGKIGAAVVAVRRGGATHAFDTINHMYLMSNMIVPGSIYWNMAYGLDKGQVLGDEEGLNNMRHLGEAIDWLARAVKPHLANYPKP